MPLVWYHAKLAELKESRLASGCGNMKAPQPNDCDGTHAIGDVVERCAIIWSIWLASMTKRSYKASVESRSCQWVSLSPTVLSSADPPFGNPSRPYRIVSCRQAVLNTCIVELLNESKSVHKSRCVEDKLDSMPAILRQAATTRSFR